MELKRSMPPPDLTTPETVVRTLYYAGATGDIATVRSLLSAHYIADHPNQDDATTMFHFAARVQVTGSREDPGYGPGHRRVSCAFTEGGEGSEVQVIKEEDGQWRAY